MAIVPNTTKEFFINQVVIKDYLVDKIRAKMVFRPYAEVNSDLKGTSGDTLTIPKISKIIDDATEVAEGAEIPFDTIGTETTEVKIKKIARGISFTTEALTRSYVNIESLGLDKLAESMAQKMDNDCLATLKTKQLYLDIAKPLGRESLSQALTGFGENEAEGEKILFVHPLQVADLRNDPTFLTANSLAQDIIIKGSIGMLWGVHIVPTEKITAITNNTKYTNILIKRGALGLAEKRDLVIEMQKDITKDILNVVATQHYATYLRDASRVITFNTKAVDTSVTSFVTHQAKSNETTVSKKGK